mmetsp:Transcript_24556/g.53426  ORF Transcript_24556/g.53426 Transcript_24556/m.53426 type:complete len:83 (+) Transcript_24556:123-371(+)
MCVPGCLDYAEKESSNHGKGSEKMPALPLQVSCSTRPFAATFTYLQDKLDEKDGTAEGRRRRKDPSNKVLNDVQQLVGQAGG